METEKAQELKSEEKIKILWEIIKRYDGFISAVNYKASLLLTFCTSILVGTVFKTKDIFGNADTCILKSITLIVSACILFAGIKSIYHLLQAIFPQTNSHPTEKSIIFFGDVAKTKEYGAEYHRMIVNLSDHEALKDLSFQAYELASIASIKFQEIKKAVKAIKIFLLPSSVIFLVLAAYFR